MTISLKTVVVLLSLLLFAIAAIGVPTGRVGAVAAGLFLWELSTVVP